MTTSPPLPFRRATVRDVARAAGVSPTTVSNVVNGRWRYVSAETRERVEREIDRLKYRPDGQARGLRLARHFAVGMVVLHDDPAFLAEPFETMLMAGLGDVLSEHGYSLVVQGLRPSQIDEAVILRRIATDGLCAHLAGSADERARLQRLLVDTNQPLVLFQDRPKRPLPDVCSVRQDDFGGGYALGLHILQAGAGRLLLLRPRFPWPALLEREQGIRAAVAGQGGGATLAALDCPSARYADTQGALAAWLAAHEPPDAILASNDHMAIAALKLVQSRGMRVPEAIMITGFNGFEFWQYTDPMITTVRSPAYELGQRGGLEMIRRLRGGSFEVRDVSLAVSFLQGGSTRIVTERSVADSPA